MAPGFFIRNLIDLLVKKDVSVSLKKLSIESLNAMDLRKVKGVFLNRIPPEEYEAIRKEVIPSLRDKGIPCIVTLQEEPSLSFRSLREIKNILSGDLLCGEEKLDQLTGRVTVGSDAMKGDLRIFKMVYNKIILLDPLFTDEKPCEPSPPGKIAGILLTGGRKPAVPVLEAVKNHLEDMRRLVFDVYTK